MSDRKSIKKNSHIFEGRILEFEMDLVEYHLNMVVPTPESKKLALIRAYLSIHGQLTQGQLKELTNFSISTISTNLTNLITAGYIKRKMKPGTHEYIYFPTPASEDYIDQALGNVKPDIDFLKIKINELGEIDDSTNKKGYALLLSRLKETLRTFQIYHEILDAIQNPDITINIEELKEPEEIFLEDIQFLEDDFDPKLKKIEEDILDFFMHQSAYSILKGYEIIFFVYFITRKVLTQEKLRKLTGLSYGKVSQVLKNLLDVQLIEKVEKKELQKILPKEKTLKIHYIMITFQKSFMMSGVHGSVDLPKWEDKFKIIRSELERDKQKLKKLNGYDEIFKQTNDLLIVIQFYKKASEYFLKFL